MEFLNWFIDPVKTQYADFEGRSTKQQFWMYVAVYIGVAIAVAIVAGIIGMPFLSNILSLALIVPSWAIGARRLHDVGKSGWWQLLGIIPVIGIIILIVWWIGEGDEESNQYGTNPKASPEAEGATTEPQEAPVAEETPAEPQA